MTPHQNLALQTQLLYQISTSTLTVSEMFTQAREFGGLGKKEKITIQVQLLKDISGGSETLNELLDLSKCVACLSEQTRNYLNTQLLASSVEEIGGYGCFDCLSDDQLITLQTWLYYQISGSTETISELFSSASCIGCLGESELSSLKTYFISVDGLSGDTNFLTDGDGALLLDGDGANLTET